jgi:hypothetical protein
MKMPYYCDLHGTFDPMAAAAPCPQCAANDRGTLGHVEMRAIQLAGEIGELRAYAVALKDAAQGVADLCGPPLDKDEREFVMHLDRLHSLLKVDCGHEIGKANETTTAVDGVASQDNDRAGSRRADVAGSSDGGGAAPFARVFLERGTHWVKLQCLTPEDMDLIESFVKGCVPQVGRNAEEPLRSALERIVAITTECIRTRYGAENGLAGEVQMIASAALANNQCVLPIEPQRAGSSAGVEAATPDTKAGSQSGQGAPYVTWSCPANANGCWHKIECRRQGWCHVAGSIERIEFVHVACTKQEGER